MIAVFKAGIAIHAFSLKSIAAPVARKLYVGYNKTYPQKTLLIITI